MKKIVFISSLILAVFMKSATFGQDCHEQNGYKVTFEGAEVGQENLENLKEGINFIFCQYNNNFDFYFEDLNVKVRIFGDYYSYKVYQLGFSRTTTDGAFYSSRFNEAIVWQRKETPTLYSDIFHEVNHLLFRNVKSSSSSDFRNRPLWLNEGLSEYYEKVQVMDGGIKIEPQKVKALRCKEWVENGQLLSLRDYLGKSNRDWRKSDHKNTRYQSRTVAWSLVYFLMSNAQGREALKKIVRYIEKRQYDKGVSVAAVERAYIGGLDKLERDWHSFLLETPKIHVYPRSKVVVADKREETSELGSPSGE